MRAERTARGAAVLVLMPIVWGVVLFGAVYPWTYVPLLAGITFIGGYGWLQARTDERRALRGFAAALLILIAIPVLQLVPVPAAALERFHPALDELLRRSDFSYAIARDVGSRAVHPLSIAPDATARGLAFLVALSTYTLGCTALLSKMRTDALVRALAALGAALAVFGIVQRATFNDRIYWVWEPINVASNAFGPFVNRNHFAGWMVMTASLTAGYLIGLVATDEGVSGMSWRRRVAWLSSSAASRITLVAAAVLLMVLSIIWTLSRSGIAAMALAGTLLALHATAGRGGRGRLAGAGFLLVALLAAIAWRGADDVAAWYGRTETLAWRLDLWSDTLPIVQDFWLTGTGLNTYGVSTKRYPMTDPSWHAMEAHNDYLQVLSEGGLVLTLAGLIAVAVLVRGIRRAFGQPQSTTVYWVRCGAVVGMMALAVQETVEFSLQIPGNAVLFTVLLAIALHRAPVLGDGAELST